MQNYKIFVQNTVFYLCQRTTKLSFEPDYTLDIEDIDLERIKTLSHHYHKILCICQNTAEALEKFKSHFETVKAAGGIVLNHKNEMLWIKRLGKWDLPKGKIELNESSADAAVREVEEETGISQLAIKKYLTSTYHTYDIYGVENIKETIWYLMQTNYQGVSIPQLEEDITEVRWVPLTQIEQMLDNTYDSIKSLIDFWNY